MSNRGYIYTVAALMFSLVLLAVISLYYQSYQTTSEIDPVKIRTDELHYFVESCKKDISRSMVISGRRAAIYMVDYSVNNSVPLADPEQTLKELLINGTITSSGTTNNITYMKNNTLSVWLKSFMNVSETLNFESNLSFVSIDIYHYDSWHFMEVITLSFNISDRRTAKGAMCSYYDPNVKIYSLVPLDGVEDPIYPLKTANKVRRYVAPGADTDIGDADVLARDANYHGSGTGGGIVFDMSDSPAKTNDNITEYNSTYPELVPYTLFIMQFSPGSLSSQAADILKLSGGVLNYDSNPMDNMGFPYVSRLNPLNKINFTDIGYAAFKNKGNSHTVLKLRLVDYVEQHLYHTSIDGPCFFDRVSQNLNLSEKYINQSKDIRSFFGIAPDPHSGLEAYVNVSEFAYYKLYEYGILPPYINQSSIDYYYFVNKSGRWLCGTPYQFGLDPGHAVKYNLSAFICDPALAGYWAMDEGAGSDVYDESRSGNDGKIQNVPGWTQGIRGGAVQLTGSNYVTVQDSDSLDATGDLSITMWINPGVQVNALSDVINKRSGGGYAVEQSGGNYYLVWDSPIGQMGDTISTGLQPNSWQYLVIVKSGLDISIYVNGTLRRTGTVGNETIVTNGGQLAIGEDILTPNTNFNGEIDELRIWRTALSPDEVLEEYRSYS